MIHPVLIAADHSGTITTTPVHEVAIVTLLREMTTNGILLDTADNRLSTSLRNLINTFSPNYRQEANMLLGNIAVGQRVKFYVPLDVTPRAPQTCADLNHAASIVTGAHLVLGSECPDCARSCPPFRSTDTIESCIVGSVISGLKSSAQASFAARTSPEAFRQQIIAPLVSLTNSITLYDPLVGSKLDEKEAPKPSENFLRGVRAILAMIEYSRKPSSRGPMRVRIVTRLPSYGIGAQYLVWQLRKSWEEALQVVTKFPSLVFSIHYKDIRKDLFHDRYIATEHIALSISKGLDIVSANHTMMKCRVDVLANRDELTEIESATDLR